jgi:FAD/FMN-containing dehydrogenase
MNDIPEEALKTIEETFGTRFVWHADGEEEPDAGQPFASVFPENAAEVESLTRLAARHRIPLKARGAGTAINPGRAPREMISASFRRNTIPSIMSCSATSPRG